MQVKLLAVTQNAQALIYAAMRQCYGKRFIGDSWPIHEHAEDFFTKQEDLITQVLGSGHESPIEHVTFTFAVDGISRACSHQLVRHRIASYSQQSQRYVTVDDFDYICPLSITNKGRKPTDIFEDAMWYLYSAYNRLLELGIPEEDARYVIPNAAETKLVLTMNCRSLLNFFGQRCCTRAQWEIRNLANAMLEICRKELPVVFDHAGAKCERLGYCPEGEKFTCGRKPRLIDLTNKDDVKEIKDAVRDQLKELMKDK